MSDFNLFSNIPPLGQLYFFYGLTFFLLGISILLKETKASDLKLARHLHLLVWFAFTHGAHEWTELYLMLRKQYIPHIPLDEKLWIKAIAIFLLILSFLFLLMFGIRIILSINNHRNMKWVKKISVIPFSLWVIFLVLNSRFAWDCRHINAAELSARPTFGLFGALLTGYGLIKYSNTIKRLSHLVSKKLFYAGSVFIFYSIFTGLFPSRTLFPYLPIPIEVLRSISAIFITYFIIRALNIFDIETKRKLEERIRRLAQTEKLASLGQLAAGVAHEINNPLTNISLNVQMLKDRLKGIANPETIGEKLNAIERNIVKASTIAKELLQFSRSTESEMRAVNINQILIGALTLLQYKFKDIGVHQNLSEVPDITGDPVKLEQVFINVLDNAAEAMSASGSFDTEICIESSYNDGWITVRIADSGAGIPKENLQKVFEPFFSTKDVGEGVGLGLSICYGIVTQHGGKIDIASVQGEGTVVTVMFPVPIGKD